MLSIERIGALRTLYYCPQANPTRLFPNKLFILASGRNIFEIVISLAISVVWPLFMWWVGCVVLFARYTPCVLKKQNKLDFVYYFTRFMLCSPCFERIFSAFARHHLLPPHNFHFAWRHYCYHIAFCIARVPTTLFNCLPTKQKLLNRNRNRKVITQSKNYKNNWIKSVQPTNEITHTQQMNGAKKIAIWNG